MDLYVHAVSTVTVLANAQPTHLYE